MRTPKLDRPTAPKSTATATKDPKQQTAAAAAAPSLEPRLAFEDFLALLSAKDRQNAEKHVLAVEALPEGKRHATLWKRLATALATLAPHAAKLGPQQSVLFFVPDGPYKMQVFALHDPRDGGISLYCGDMLAEATKQGVLSPAPGAASTAAATATEDAKASFRPYRVAGTEDVLLVEPFDATAGNLPAFSRNLVGWSRRAIHLRIPVEATEPQIQAVEKLCLLTAQKLKKA
ncbi:MAG TPA: hypothetical protein VK324_05705 [Tepidisphaeraceae bacterium]|nr:hypothetical protein [Tepidisphaeraceae bacterium]